MGNLQQLQQDRTAHLAEMRGMLDRASAEGRELSRDETKRFRHLERQVEDLDDRIAEAKASWRAQRAAAGDTSPDEPFDPRLAQGPYGGGDRPDQRATLGREDRVTDWVARRGGRGYQGAFAGEIDPGEFSFGRVLRGMVTGDWQGADVERRALSEGVSSAGGFLVPEPLGARLVDRARNAARVFQAGAQTVPMQVDELNLARLTGGATVGWKVENDPIVDSSMVFDRITFRAKTLPILVKLSTELFEDLSPEASDLIETEIAAALALELDRVALRGTGVDPIPKGIRNHTGVTVIELGAGAGATPSYDNFIDGLSAVRDANFDPTGVVMASRTQKTLDKLKDSQLRYLDPPASYAALSRFLSNQVPVNLTVGASTDCSEVYIGQWSELLIGIRTNFIGIRILDQRFAENLQHALLTHIRADVQVAHGPAFTVLTGVRP